MPFRGGSLLGTVQEFASGNGWSAGVQCEDLQIYSVVPGPPVQLELAGRQPVNAYWSCDNHARLRALRHSLGPGCAA